MKRAAASAPEWSIESRFCGTVTSNDVPKLMTRLLREVFPSQISTRLSQPNDVLKMYAKGQQKMGRTVGARFVAFLDERAEEIAEKEKAASAGTETTPRSEDNEETSPDIVPQSQEEKKDMTVETAKKRGRPPKFRLDEPAEQVADQVTDQVTNQVAEVGKMVDQTLPATEAEALRAELVMVKEQLNAKTFEAADLRAHLKTRTEETIELRAHINDLKAQNDELRQAMAGISQMETTEQERENEVLRQRIFQLESDNAGCGPARVDELETKIEKLERQHVEDLELIRDMCRNLLDWRGDE